MRRRQMYAARTAEAASAPAAAIESKELTVPDKPPQQQPVMRPPVRRAAKPKTTKAPK